MKISKINSFVFDRQIKPNHKNETESIFNHIIIQVFEVNSCA